MHRVVRSAGFTLAETAIALAIIGSVMALMVPLFLNLRADEQLLQTDRKLEGAMQAIAAYVQANGCIPCPYNPALGLNTNYGTASFTGTNNGFCGTCAVDVGMVPFRALGISETMGRDGYGYWLSYAVDKGMTGGALFGAIATPPTTVCKAGDAAPCTTATTGLRRAGLCQNFSSGQHKSLIVNQRGTGTTEAAVMLISHGRNHYGAYIQRSVLIIGQVDFPGNQAVCSSTGGGEQCNARTSNNGNFADYLPLAVSGDAYDDRTLYLSRDALVTYLGGPACGSSGT